MNLINRFAGDLKKLFRKQSLDQVVTHIHGQQKS